MIISKERSDCTGVQDGLSFCQKSDLRLNDDTDLNFLSMAQCLMFVYGWAHRVFLMTCVC